MQNANSFIMLVSQVTDNKQLDQGAFMIFLLMLFAMKDEATINTSDTLKTQNHHIKATG